MIVGIGGVLYAHFYPKLGYYAQKLFVRKTLIERTGRDGIRPLSAATITLLCRLAASLLFSPTRPPPNTAFCPQKYDT